jgi:hypothetical protein
MVGPTDRDPSEQREKTSPRSCALCGDHQSQSQRPRHQVLLEDEAPASNSRIVSHSVCATCWETLYTALAENGTTPNEFHPDGERRRRPGIESPRLALAVEQVLSSGGC